MDDEKIAQTRQPSGHHTDAYATKLVDKTASWQQKVAKLSPGKQEDKSQPAGGFDDTPIPSAPPGFTVRFTFHRATNLPMADLNSFSSDPYVYAQLNTGLSTRHKQDPYMRFRTPTIRRSTEPVWDCQWIVANIPASGFKLKARIYDEDPADHDDRLGNVHVNVDSIGDDWPGIREQSFKIKKRMGSKRAYLIRGCAAMFSKNLQMSGNLFVSAEVLGRTEVGNNGGRVWTVGPCAWSRHYSPLIGFIAGTKDYAKEGEGSGESYNFQANQIQLAGPVPPELYHRYVEFRPFIAGMFNSKSLQGRILNRALHHQHSRIYNYDRSTVYGSFPSPSKDMSLQFLDLVHYDRGGRIFTYVITLDGMWRFTETGKEFGIDLLSKHTMHSDVNIYIAFSGEFFIRRLKTPHKDAEDEGQETHPAAEIEGGPPCESPPSDPGYYALYIDNDSGTYRPNSKMLPLLKKFMHRNLPGVKIVTLDCLKDEKKMTRLKQEQRERKKKEGKTQVFLQDDGSSSISSSDASELERRLDADGTAGQDGKEGGGEERHETMSGEPRESRDVVNGGGGGQEREEKADREDYLAGESNEKARPQ